MALTFLQANGSADATTHTFSGENLGTASADRYIIVNVSGRSGVAGRTISSVTIGGVTATESVQAGDANNKSVAGIYIANVPTGATGDIVVTFSGSKVCGIGVYHATNLASTTPTDTGSDTSGTSPLSDTLNINAGGFAIACSLEFDPSMTWTNLDEDYDEVATGSNPYHSGASKTFDTEQTALSITGDWGISNAPILVMASWGTKSPYTPTKSLNTTTTGLAYASDHTDLDLGDTFTIEGWFNADVFNTIGVLVGKWSTSGSNRSYGCRIYNDGGDIKLQLYTDADGSAGGATVSTSDIVTMNTGTWYHLAFILDSNTSQFYLDGADVGGGHTLSTPASKNGEFVIGAERTNGTDGSDGTFGLWRVWKGVARTQTEIQDNMCKTLDSVANLSAEWTLDDVYTDNSGNAHTLTSSGTQSFVTDTPSTCGTVATQNSNFLTYL